MEVCEVDADNPDPHVIARAAEIIRAGGLVAFPTETVYGLGANGLDGVAVGRIFNAKGRPSHNPVILHVAEIGAARELSLRWPAAADRLARRFWPGPLTLVVKCAPHVPDEVTAGGDTVGIRIPNSAVALALIRASGVPLAAPSANRSTQLSPTTAGHVLLSFGEEFGMILDGGPTSGGIESTVLDLSAVIPKVLRPGLLPPDEIERVLKETVARPQENAVRERPRSPGMMERHYAPRTKLEAVEGSAWGRVDRLLEAGNRVAWLTFGERKEPGREGLYIIAMPEAPKEYSARLYSTLHELDAMQFARIVAELPPARDEWLAVRDRLRRAAALGQ